MSWFTEANKLLRRAIADNIFDPRPEAIQRWSLCKEDKLTALMFRLERQKRQSPTTESWLQKQSSWQLPATRRYVQSRFPPTTPSVQPNSALDWMVEVARYPVAIGSVGIIKSLEQYVATEETVYTMSANWGNPFVLGLPISWHLRLSPLRDVASPWVSISGASAVPDRLPGFAYDDLHRTDDIWFPAASCVCGNVHFVIPGSYFLRVVCIVAASQNAVSVACKLAGSIQLETNSEAQYTVRTTW